MSSYTLIDSARALHTVIADISDLPQNPPSLYLDLEGVKLSRHGTISIMQMHVVPGNKTYLIDIHTLGQIAFDTTASNGVSLRSVLQSASVPKVFFDVRNDADALFYHYRVSLAGVIDLQVMEYATRTYRRSFVCGLAKALERDSGLTTLQRVQCQRIKENGIKLFDPQVGGNYEVFNQRPLQDDIVLYCVQDVQWLPLLWEAYTKKMTKSMSVKTAEATVQRVENSKSPQYVSHGPHKTIGPW